MLFCSRGISGAAMMKKAALLLSVEDNAIILQEPPVNTYEEAKYYAENFSNEFPAIWYYKMLKNN